MPQTEEYLGSTVVILRAPTTARTRSSGRRRRRTDPADGAVSPTRAVEHSTDRIQVHTGDQLDLELLDRITDESGPLDLVIDDGGHRADEQQGTLQHLWGKLRPGAIYVIEDLHTSYLERWGMAYGQEGTTIEWLKDRLDDVQHASHGEPVVLAGLAELHVHPKTCVLRKA